MSIGAGGTAIHAQTDFARLTGRLVIAIEKLLQESTIANDDPNRVAIEKLLKEPAFATAKHVLESNPLT